MNHKSTIDAEEINKFSQLASQWWNREGPLKTLHDINPARLAFMQNSVNLDQKKVLDVGCGGGILSEGLAKLGALVTGIDAEECAIAAAKLHAEQNKLSIEYLCSPIESYQGECFDVLTCMEMLEHVQEPQLVIDHCARLLKPGGTLFLSTLNRTWKAYLAAIVGAEYLLHLLPKQTHDFEKFIKPSELVAMTRKAGLTFNHSSGFGYNPFTRQASLTQSVAVNYLVSCSKP